MTECNAIIEANNEIDKLKRENKKLNELCVKYGFDMGRLEEENEQLKSENQRLTDKLNKTALELVGECISQGKATEISEMSYSEFLDYRARNGKPMELHK